MKITYTLEGLDCAVCAETIRSESEKLEYVKSATMNFMMKELAVELHKEKDKTDVHKDIRKLVTTLEPDVNVIEKGIESSEEKVSYTKDIVCMAISLVILVMNIAFTFPPFIELPLFFAAYLLVGYEVLLQAFKNILKGRVFDENFLMAVASIGAIALGEYAEAVAVMLFYQIGELFQTISVNRSRRSITDLMNIKAEYANVLIDGDYKKVSPDSVKVGDVIMIKPGERVPLDCTIVDGSSALDTAALTGESIPRDVRTGDAIISGSINKGGVLTASVDKVLSESTVTKMIELVENASARKANTENFITKFARIYTPVVCLAAVLLAIVPPLFDGFNFAMWVQRALIFLVVSCPCALVISVPLSYFGGIGKAAKNGILVKGSNYLEALSKVDTVVFDKTGTLTKGKFKVTKVVAKGISSEELLETAAYAESLSTHPIGVSIVEEFNKTIDGSLIKSLEEVSGKGIKAVIKGKNVAVGNSKLMREVGADSVEIEDTNVQVAVNGKAVGYIIIADEVKESSKQAIARLAENGVQKSVILTGDNKRIADKIAEELNVTECYSELLPQNKVEIMEEIENKQPVGKYAAFVGDGINDSPVIARADVGIAMGKLGSDSAIEAADVVLMNDDPMQISSAIKIARQTKRIVMQNIVFALAVKLAVQVLGACGIADMWAAVFADVGVTIIAILNAMRLMRK